MNIATSVATWSLRERAVCSLPADRAGELGQPPLDRHVDVLVVGREREAPAVELGLDRVEAREQRVAVVLADDPAGAASMRACARDCCDVVGPEAPVEADRGVQALEGRVLRLGEARHARASLGARPRPRACGPSRVSPSAICATCVARREAEQVQGDAPAVRRRCGAARGRSGCSGSRHGSTARPARDSAQAERHAAAQHVQPGDEVGRASRRNSRRDVGDDAMAEHDRQRGAASRDHRAAARARAGASHRAATHRRSGRAPAAERASASRRARPGPSVIAGKNGSASERAATSSHTGNSPSRWPNARGSSVIRWIAGR